MKKLPITVVILTFNEELNLPICLDNISQWVNEIFVVDSYSDDKTKEIAEEYGAKVFEHPFRNQAQQFNWALDNLKIKNNWVLRLDADERLTDELWKEIEATLPSVRPDIGGFYIKRRVYFMGRWIRHGGYYPTWLLRLFRRGAGKSEDREMDEHVILSRGRTVKLKNDFIDDNQKGLSFWIEKHNQFASREVREAVKLMRDEDAAPEKNIGEEAARKRLAKGRYYSQPIFLRAFLYFLYRYIFLLGFLDGVKGLIFHMLQGFWYRFLVDAKLYENNLKSQKSNLKITSPK